MKNIFFLQLIFVICKIDGLTERNFVLRHEENVDNNLEPLDSKSLLKKQAANMLKFMDRATDPCHNFHQFACGNWKKYNDIPIDKESYDLFEMLKDQLIDLLQEIFTTTTIDSKVENPIRQIKNLFDSCIDVDAINRRKSEPVLRFLQRLGDFPLLNSYWSEKSFNLERTLSILSLHDMDCIFQLHVISDLKDTNKHIIHLINPTLGLNSQAYYLDSKYEHHLDAYRNFIIEIFTILKADENEIKKVADEIIKLEIKLANLTDSRTKTYKEIYSTTNLSDLIENYPKFNWMYYFNRSFQKSFDVDTKIGNFMGSKFNDIYNLLINTDKRIMANYLNWIAIQKLVRYLDDRFGIPLAKLTKALTGSEIESQSRVNKCTITTNALLDFAVSAIYVKKYFNENSKAEFTAIAEGIKQTFRENLIVFDWLDDETKHLAEVKLNKTSLELGYPDNLLNQSAINEYYKDLELQPGEYFENILKIRKFHIDKVIQKLDQNDSYEIFWPVSPTQVNAFFQHPNNRVIIPAGFLQPPIYYKNFPKALNFGAIGTFFGHELTHGFDSNGRTFNENGKIKNWWSNSSIDSFKKMEQCFVDQYGKFSIFNKTINGDLSKTENVADNGGLQLSFKTYQKWLSTASDEEKKTETLPGLEFLSSQQLFFLNFAQSWCDNIRPEAVEMKLSSDAHLPWMFRILGTLQNFNGFSEAYQCSKESFMNPSNKCKLW